MQRPYAIRQCKSAKDAKASELAANDSAVEASKSAQSAGESASAASTSTSNAAASVGAINVIAPQCII